MVAPITNENETHEIYNVNSHFPLEFVLKISQWFGFFPVVDLSEDTVCYFKWLSPRMAYSLLTALGALFLTILNVFYVARVNGDLFEITGCVFYLCGSISCILFIRLAQYWPQLMKDYEKMESTIHVRGTDQVLHKKLKIITTVFLSIALVEHLTVQILQLTNSFHCGRTFSEAIDHFFSKASYPQIFYSLNYSIWIGILCQLVNVQMTFSWTFVDLFVIQISCVFSSLLQQIRERVKIAIKLQVDNLGEWRAIREDFCEICQVIDLFKDRIGDIVILSFFTNLYFILIQLFKTMRGNTMDLERVYFYMSLFLVIARVTCVCFFGATIYDENRKLIPLLESVSPLSYNKEVRRFIREATCNKVSLDGRSFFRITRSLILEFASAVVTYELILVQFNGYLLEKNFYANKTCP